MDAQRADLCVDQSADPAAGQQPGGDGSEPNVDAQPWRGLGFRIGARRLASELTQLRQLLPILPITPVPGAQPWLAGVANVRDEVLPVVDLELFLQVRRSMADDRRYLLRLRQDAGDVAILIDAQYGQCRFAHTRQIPLEAAVAASGEPLAAGRFTDFLDRAYRVGDQDWGVLRLDRLLRAAQWSMAALSLGSRASYS